MSTLKRVLATSVMALSLGSPLCAADAPAPDSAPAAYTEVFYPSGDLKIQAYLYRPAGTGPFPVILYNHGSRQGRERKPNPWTFIGKMLTEAGYAVLVPERRGYGRSDGPTLGEVVGNETGDLLIRRLEAEADDVVAGVAYLRHVPFADTSRMGAMGWSFGGVVTMLLVGRVPLRAAVDQAGGALTWSHSPAMRSALVEAARRCEVPVLLMVARNDRTAHSVQAVADVLASRTIPHRLVIYDPYTPVNNPYDPNSGHRIFAQGGAEIWKNDVVEFLDRHVKAPSEPQKSIP